LPFFERQDGLRRSFSSKMVFSTNHKYHVISRSRPFLFPSFFISIVLTSNLSWPWWSTISKGNKMLVFGEKRRLYPEIRMFAYEQCNCRILYFVAWSPLEAEEKTSCDIYFHLDFSPFSGLLSLPATKWPWAIKVDPQTISEPRGQSLNARKH